MTPTGRRVSDRTADRRARLRRRTQHNGLDRPRPAVPRSTGATRVAKTPGCRCSTTTPRCTSPRSAPTGEVQLRDWTGERVPPHCVSSGLVLLAHCPGRRFSERILAGPLPRLTARTMVAPAKLRRRLAAIAAARQRVGVRRVRRRHQLGRRPGVRRRRPTPSPPCTCTGRRIASLVTATRTQIAAAVAAAAQAVESPGCAR